MTNDFEIGKLQSFHSNIFGPLQDKNFIIIVGSIYDLPLVDIRLSSFQIKLDVYITRILISKPIIKFVPENSKEGKYLREIIMFKEAILNLIDLVELKCK